MSSDWTAIRAKLASCSIEDANGCRLWTKAASHRSGKHPYGNVWLDGGIYQAHRLSYLAHIGPIPPGHHLHHLCDNTLCINPAHLQPVTPSQHTHVEPNSCAKRTHCPNGHEYTTGNTIRRMAPGSNGKLYEKRFCRICKRLDDDRRRQRNTQWRVTRRCKSCGKAFLPMFRRHHACSQACYFTHYFKSRP